MDATRLFPRPHAADDVLVEDWPEHPNRIDESTRTVHILDIEAPGRQGRRPKVRDDRANGEVQCGR